MQAGLRGTRRRLRFSINPEASQSDNPDLGRPAIDLSSGGGCNTLPSVWTTYLHTRGNCSLCWMSSFRGRQEKRLGSLQVWTDSLRPFQAWPRGRPKSKAPGNGPFLSSEIFMYVTGGVHSRPLQSRVASRLYSEEAVASAKHS